MQGAKVVAKAVKQGRAAKIIVFKYKAKKNYRRRAVIGSLKLEIKSIQAKQL